MRTTVDRTERPLVRRVVGRGHEVVASVRTRGSRDDLVPASTVVGGDRDVPELQEAGSA